MSETGNCGIGRRGFCASFGAGLFIATVPRFAVGAPRKVVAATGLDPYHVPYAVAARHRLFEKHGLELDYKPFNEGSVALDALLTNSSHMGSASQVAGLTRWEKTRGLHIAGTVASSNRRHAMVGSAAIQNPEDLIGGTVAFPKFTAGHYFFDSYARKHGLPIDQIKTKQIAASETVAALKRGDIDAFFLWEPWPSRAIDLVEGAHAVAWGEDLGLNFSTMNYYSRALVEDHELAVAVTRGLIDATDFCENDLEETARIASEEFRISRDDAIGYISKLNYRVEMRKDRLLPDLVDYANFCLQANLITEMPNWDEFLRPQIMKDAAPDRMSGWS